MKKLAIILVQIAVAAPLLAQVPPPGPVPLDPVSWVVLAAGGVLAGKRYYDNKRKKDE